MKYCLAIDMGASSGRHILGYIEDGKLKLQEIYRFDNGIIDVDGTLCWDIEKLFEEKGSIVSCFDLAAIYINLGLLFSAENNLDYALEYYHKALNLHKEINKYN